MENNDITRQLFIHKMIEILKKLNKFEALNNPALEKEIKNQTELIEKLKKAQKLKYYNIIEEFDFYKAAIESIIESTKELNLFIQNKILIKVCENCNRRNIQIQCPNILSYFDMSKRFGNEFILEEFFSKNKVEINCYKCRAKNYSVKAERIFNRIPEYLIILFKNNDKKIKYPEINLSLEYLDLKNDGDKFIYKIKRGSYNLKALMVKENSDFSCIMINQINDLDKYKNNSKFEIPLVLLYHKEEKDGEVNDLKPYENIIKELEKYYRENIYKNINNNNGNNIQYLNQPTKNIINSLINNNQNNNNKVINNNIPNYNNFYNFNNNQINMINNFNQNYINQNQNNTNYNNKIVLLTFTFPVYEKDLHIEINENLNFSKVIDELKKKYIYLKELKDLRFFLNNKEIDNKKTVKENGLNDSNKIIIKFRDE